MTTDECLIQPVAGAEKNTITLSTANTEMLKVAADGFYVRGKKVPVDDAEARSVYEAFKSWLTWVSLTRDYQ